MYKKLSIIIPCYNSEETLEEAVLSLNTQKFTSPHEIVIVNDGSTDKTEELIISLAKNNPNIKYVAHESNKGGAAAFNTAIEYSTGDVIFCLDSDNVLAPDTLPRMFDFMNEKKADGVAFSEQRFFAGKNKEKYKTQINDLGGKAVSLIDLLKPDAVLLDQFMMSKQSYYEVGGHPLHHGFTGQCFEIKFVSKGKKAYFCPNTPFYHRNADKKSWFERVYETGVFSKNFYLIFEDVMHLLTPKVRVEILKYDIYKNASLYGKNIKQKIASMYSQGEDILENNELYLETDGWNLFYKDHMTSTAPEDIFCLAIHEYKNAEYDKALTHYKELLQNGWSGPVVYFNILRVLIAISGKYNKNDIEERSDELINNMTLKPQEPLFRKWTPFERAMRKVKNILKKFLPENK